MSAPERSSSSMICLVASIEGSPAVTYGMKPLRATPRSSLNFASIRVIEFRDCSNQVGFSGVPLASRLDSHSLFLSVVRPLHLIPAVSMTEHLTINHGQFIVQSGEFDEHSLI